MQRKLFSILLTSAFATSVYASEPNVISVDVKGDSHISEYDICKKATTAPEIVISDDGTTLTVNRGNATEATLAVTEGATVITFDNYLNGIGDTDSDYQAPASSGSNYLVQNAGNLAYVVTKLGDTTAPANASYVQTQSIDASDIVATLDPNTTAFTGTFSQENEDQTITGLKLSGSSANPLSNGTGSVTADMQSATIMLNNANTNVDAAISAAAKTYTLYDVPLVDLTDLKVQTPSDATTVSYGTKQDAPACTYSRDVDHMTQYISLCLPFALAADDVPGEAWIYNGYELSQDGQVCKIKFAKLDTSNGLAAKTPVIIKTSNPGEVWSVNLTDVDPFELIDNEIGHTTNGIYGSFNTVNITGKYLKIGTDATSLMPIPADGGRNFPFRSCIYVGESSATATAYVADFDEESGVDHVDGDVEDAIINVYTLQGALVAKSIKSSEAASKLDNGVYVTSKGDKLIIK